MRYLIASDVHGSAYFTQKLLYRFGIEKADKLILLGDIYNHGPKNPLPNEFNELKVASLLNNMLDKLIVIKGNCDSEVDTLISNFDFINDMLLESGNKSVFLTHGHIYNKDSLPKTKFDCIIYGHFHTGFIKKIGDTTFANTGSISLPKDNTPESYIILEDGKLTLKDIDGKVIEETNI